MSFAAGPPGTAEAGSATSAGAPWHRRGEAWKLDPARHRRVSISAGLFFLKAEWHLWTGGGERGEQSGKASGSPGFGALGCDVGGPGDGQSREVQLQGALPRAHWLFTHP